MPSSQKAQDRPIAFTLHDEARNTPPQIFPLIIRPEDLTRNEPSRLSVQQTLGGAWADEWGVGVASVSLSGTTGWRGAGEGKDGFWQFQELHKTVFKRYHELRAEVAAAGLDPAKVKLIFSDGLDDFTWNVAPQNFVLKRNRTRPLLSQYQIQLVKKGDQKQGSKGSFGKLDVGLLSLDSSIRAINEFAGSIRGQVASALGPTKAGVEALARKSASALENVQRLAKAGIDGVITVAAPVMEIAQALTKAASNVLRMAATAQGIPSSVRVIFMRVAGEFTNAYCLLRNVFRSRGMLPTYNGLYGASYCSSTAGGSPMSPYVGENVFPMLFPATASPVSMTANAEKALGELAGVDPIKPPPPTAIGGLLSAVDVGVTISPAAVDAAIAARKNSKQEAAIGYV